MFFEPVRKLTISQKMIRPVGNPPEVSLAQTCDPNVPDYSTGAGLIRKLGFSHMFLVLPLETSTSARVQELIDMETSLHPWAYAAISMPWCHPRSYGSSRVPVW